MGLMCSCLNRFSSTCHLAALLAALVLIAPAYGATLNQIDDFQSGSTLGWTNGPAGDPINVDGGGPTGAADRFLQVTSTGLGGAGGRMIVFNRSQWLGSYAGITAISMDLKNLDSFSPIQPLSVRIAFKQNTSGGSPGYASANAFALPADGQWHHAIFQLSGSAMVGINAPSLTLDQLLAAPAEMRVLSSTAPALDGDITGSRLGIDNIRAIPEPGTLSLAIAALVSLAWWTRRR